MGPSPDLLQARDNYLLPLLVVGEIVSELHQLRHYVKEPAGGPASLEAI
jgi:hypothetical protein